MYGTGRRHGLAHSYDVQNAFHTAQAQLAEKAGEGQVCLLPQTAAFHGLKHAHRCTK